MLNQHIIVGRQLIAPGLSTPDYEPSHLERATINKYVGMGLAAVDKLPEAYVKAKAKAGEPVPEVAPEPVEEPVGAENLAKKRMKKRKA